MTGFLLLSTLIFQYWVDGDVMMYVPSVADLDVPHSPQVWYVVTKTKLEKLNPCNLEEKETRNFYSTLTVWNIPTSAGRKGAHQEEGAFERNFICRRKKKMFKETVNEKG